MCWGFFSKKTKKLWHDTPDLAILDQTIVSKQPARFHLKIVSKLLLQTQQLLSLNHNIWVAVIRPQETDSGNRQTTIQIQH